MPRYAALDIGSNSIRMEAAETVPGALPRILASEREVTRLGESVFHTGRLSEDAMQLACIVLRRMSERYRALEVVGARAVATSSVRDARNQAEFLERASAAAGITIEVISGREEARLIHLGVLSRWPEVGRDVLMIDIGGGSAEIIASHDGKMRDAVSKPIGAIRLREIFLEHDPPAPAELQHMQEYITERLEAAVRRFGAGKWQRAVATSGTASAVVCAVCGIPKTRREEADRRRASAHQIRQLFRKLSTMKTAERRKVTGIGPRRAEIIVPGVCVLLDALERFQPPAVRYSAAGVRDGIIADLAARGVGRELARLRPDERKEVEQMSGRYAVERAHARKVATFAGDLFEALQPLHALSAPYGRLLEAAAYLHDVGHYISDANHHKHSYYVVSNADMPGFTATEREFIANLCRYHRKALPSGEHTNLRTLATNDRDALARLIPVLRLADSLDRSHAQRIQKLECLVRDGAIALDLYSSEDIGLERWAAEQVAGLFEVTYGRGLSVRAKRPEK
jgi:exopolyphosphatase/guanosine-5'-triphosphate,3'-diphosphate pyrophosphatase